MRAMKSRRLMEAPTPQPNSFERQDSTFLVSRTQRSGRFMDAPVRPAHDESQLVRRPESAPVPALHADRNVDLAHHDGLAVAHVAGVALDQIGAGALAGS